MHWKPDDCDNPDTCEGVHFVGKRPARTAAVIPVVLSDDRAAEVGTPRTDLRPIPGVWEVGRQHGAVTEVSGEHLIEREGGTAANDEGFGAADGDLELEGRSDGSLAEAPGGSSSGTDEGVGAEKVEAGEPPPCAGDSRIPAEAAEAPENSAGPGL